MYRYSLCQNLVVPPWQRSLTWIQGRKGIRVAGRQLGVNLQIPLTQGRKGAMGLVLLMCYILQHLSPSSSSIVTLAKAATEPFNGGAGFYTTVFVVPKHNFTLPLGFPLDLQKPYCSFADARAFVLMYVWMTSWSSLTQNMPIRGHKSFCALYWFVLDYMSMFPGLHLISFSTFPFRTTLGTVDMPVSLPSDKLLWYSSGLIICYRVTYYSPSDYVLFGQDHLLCHWTCTILPMCHVIQNDALDVYHSPGHLFLSFHL